MLGVNNTDSVLEGFGPIFLSPERDIAVLFPQLMYRAYLAACEASDDEMAEAERFQRYLKRLAVFLKGVKGPDRPRTVSDLLKSSGLLDAQVSDLEGLLGKWVLRALYGAYFNGVGDAFTRKAGTVRSHDLDALFNGTPGIPDNPNSC